MSGSRRISFGTYPRYQGLIGAFFTLMLIGLCIQIISQLFGKQWFPALASGLGIVLLAWLQAARRGRVPLQGRRAWVFAAPAFLAAVGITVMAIGHWS